MMRCPASLAILILALLAAPLAAQVPATSIAASPDTARAGRIAGWFGDLADPDAAVRERAEQALLTMPTEDLPLLREAVAKARPVAPTQAAVLHDVVIHVFLTGQQYERSVGGFLGLKEPGDHQVPLSQTDGPDAATGGTGVPVGERIPGFAAYSVLRPGDVIVSLRDARGQRLRMADWGQLLVVIQQHQAGQRVLVQVLRQGRLIDLPLRLSARPDFPPLDRVSTEQFLQQRIDAAEQYWTEAFAPLVDEPVS
jgi:hypothetical protein